MAAEPREHGARVLHTKRKVSFSLLIHYFQLANKKENDILKACNLLIRSAGSLQSSLKVVNTWGYLNQFSPFSKELNREHTFNGGYSFLFIWDKGFLSYLPNILSSSNRNLFCISSICPVC